MLIETQIIQQGINMNHTNEDMISVLMNRDEKIISSYQAGFDGNLVIRYSGVPREAEIVIANDTIFRHYTSLPEDYYRIIKTSKLKGGNVPYARTSSMSKVYWEDLKGIFMTIPDYISRDVGVPDSNHFVDFRLQRNLKIIRLESGIFLIPNIQNKKIEVHIEIL